MEMLNRKPMNFEVFEDLRALYYANKKDRVRGNKRYVVDLNAYLGYRFVEANDIVNFENYIKLINPLIKRYLGVELPTDVKFDNSKDLEISTKYNDIKIAYIPIVNYGFRKNYKLWKIEMRIYDASNNYLSIPLIEKSDYFEIYDLYEFKPQNIVEEILKIVCNYYIKSWIELKLNAFINSGCKVVDRENGLTLLEKEKVFGILRDKEFLISFDSYPRVFSLEMLKLNGDIKLNKNELKTIKKWQQIYRSDMKKLNEMLSKKEYDENNDDELDEKNEVIEETKTQSDTNSNVNEENISKVSVSDAQKQKQLQSIDKKQLETLDYWIKAYS